MCVCMYLRMSVCMCVRMYIHMYVCAVYREQTCFHSTGKGGCGEGGWGGACSKGGCKGSYCQDSETGSRGGNQRGGGDRGCQGASNSKTKGVMSSHFIFACLFITDNSCVGICTHAAAPETEAY